jgi:hypothetical protein
MASEQHMCAEAQVGMGLPATGVQGCAEEDDAGEAEDDSLGGGGNVEHPYEHPPSPEHWQMETPMPVVHSTPDRMETPPPPSAPEPCPHEPLTPIMVQQSPLRKIMQAIAPPGVALVARLSS